MSLLALIGLAVLAGLLGAGLAGVTITVFLHRGITHGSHRMKPSVYAAGRWLTYFTVYMRHWEWRRIHRKHHLYTDTWIDEIRHDPHSPIIITEREGIDGYRRVSWHMAAIFHAEAKLPDIRDGTYDIPQLDRPLDSLDRRVFDHPVRGAVVTGLVYAGLFAAFAPLVLGVARTAPWELACAVAGVAALGVHIWVLLRFGGADQLRLPPRQGLDRGGGLRKEREIALVSHLRGGRAPDPPPLPAVRADQQALGPRLARHRRVAVARAHRGRRRPRNRARRRVGWSAGPPPRAAEGLHPAGGGVTSERRRVGVAGAVGEFDTSTGTSAHAAAAIGWLRDAIASSLVFMADGSPV